jgi:hypothetical protein
MNRKTLLRLAALPFVIAAGAAPNLTGCGTLSDVACPEWGVDYGASLGTQVSADVRTFMVAAGTFSELADEMVAKVSTACINIAVATGRSSSAWDGKEGGDLVQAACDEADAGMQAVFAAAGDISVEFLVEGGECKASITATGDCYATCEGAAECTPAQLEAKCEPGKLAGSCSGECTGSCDGGTIACQGSCDATCTGSCDANCIGRCDGTESSGACAGECDGQCTGSCDGTCSGKCEYQAVTCEGTCHGDCSVEFQEPYCEGKFTPPECNIDVDCKASCDASIQAEAVCTPPKVSFNVIGTGTADLTALAAAIETNLPDILLYAYERGVLLKDTGVQLVTSGEAIANGSAELSTKAVACLVPAVAAATDASIKVEVSVSVSASVAGTAQSRSQ